MTVGDLQKYLCGLADAVGAVTKSPAKDLIEVADRLAPFAQHQFAAFAEFLKLADEYRTTGKLPEPGTKPVKPKAVKVPKPPPPAKLQPTEVVALVESLQNRVLADANLSREGVEAELRAIEKRLTAPQWKEVVGLLGYKEKPKSVDEVIKTLVNYSMARRAGLGRSDA